MLIAAVVLLCCTTSQAVATSNDIRGIDFASWQYPWRGSEDWPHNIQWQDVSEPNRVRLERGRWKVPEDRSLDSNPIFSGLTLDEVIYGDLTGDQTDEAVVVLRFDTGGTQFHYWVYIFGICGNRPKLLGYFRAGDRAAEGLYRAYVRNKSLIVEVYDPDRRQGDCCSSGFRRYRYKWDGMAFVRSGTIQRGVPITTSRRAVSIFGMPREQMHRSDGESPARRY